MQATEVSLSERIHDIKRRLDALKIDYLQHKVHERGWGIVEESPDWVRGRYGIVVEDGAYLTWVDSAALAYLIVHMREDFAALIAAIEEAGLA